MKRYAVEFSTVVTVEAETAEDAAEKASEVIDGTLLEATAFGYEVFCADCRRSAETCACEPVHVAANSERPTA